MNEWAGGLEKFTLSEPCLSLVVAMGKNRAIGLQGKLPWHLPEDLKRFKAVTLGQPMIMGRKTYDSIGKPLPGRKTVVISRNPTPVHPEVSMAGDPWDAVREAAAWLHERSESGHAVRPEVMVCGGAEIYALFLPLAHRIYLTEVDAEPRADAFMPMWGTEWKRGFAEKLSGEAPAALFQVLHR